MTGSTLDWSDVVLSTVRVLAVFAGNQPHCTRMIPFVIEDTEIKKELSKYSENCTKLPTFRSVHKPCFLKYKHKRIHGCLSTYLNQIVNWKKGREYKSWSDNVFSFFFLQTPLKFQKSMWRIISPVEVHQLRKNTAFLTYSIIYLMSDR